MNEVSKKIVILGQYGVGKSSLIRQFVHRKFSDKYLTTIGVHVQKKVLEINGTQLSMILWDLEGDTSISKIRPAYLIGSSGLIYVFDLSRPYTYAEVDQEINLLKAQFPNEPLKIVANKKDLVGDTDLDQILVNLTVACDFVTSAKTGESVDDMFHNLGEDLLK